MEIFLNSGLQLNANVAYSFTLALKLESRRMFDDLRSLWITGGLQRS